MVPHPAGLSAGRAGAGPCSISRSPIIRRAGGPGLPPPPPASASRIYITSFQPPLHRRPWRGPAVALAGLACFFRTRVYFLGSGMNPAVSMPRFCSPFVLVSPCFILCLGNTSATFSTKNGLYPRRQRPSAGRCFYGPTSSASLWFLLLTHQLHLVSLVHAQREEAQGGACGAPLPLPLLARTGFARSGLPPSGQGHAD